MALSAAGRDARLQGWFDETERLIVAMHFVRPSNAGAMTEYLRSLEATAPTYQELGATLSDSLPVGYHHLVAGKIIGRGSETFSRATRGLRTWQAHQFKGARVFPDNTPPTSGATFVVTLGFGCASIGAPCRIVAIVEEPRRFGFAYGTLPGHPEQGEEFFVVSIGEDESVRFDIRAFSRASDSLTRLAGPIGRRVQSVATEQYLRALTRFAQQTTAD